MQALSDELGKAELLRRLVAAPERLPTGGWEAHLNAGFEGIVRVYAVADGKLQHEFLVNPSLSVPAPPKPDASEASANPETSNTSAGADR